MDSRLDRLFILLDTGSTETIRLAAAKQLGEVQRAQPSELNYLLGRIKEYSSKPNWETRTAAGHAIRCVLEQVEFWPPDASRGGHFEGGNFNSIRDKADKIIEEIDYESVILGFDIDKIVASCPKLLSLDSIEIDESESSTASSSKGTLKGRGTREGSSRRGSGSKIDNKKKVDKDRQRKLINKELGIGMVDSLNLGVKSTDIVSNDDLEADFESSYDTSSKAIKNPQADLEAIIGNAISNYENHLKVLRSADCMPETTTIPSMPCPAIGKDASQSHSNHMWPLAEITKQYTEDIFNSSWEIRHGAAIALREIMRSHGRCAGKIRGLSDRVNNILNHSWLVDMALRALCVLALDKFGDFLFDQVVAPVRENIAQLLGCCVANIPESIASQIVRATLKMLEKSNWEIRHGGILGLKYSISVVTESYSKRILQESFDHIFRCLGDPVDDVSAEAAASLIPVKDLLIETIPEKAPELVKFLWDHLTDLDELTTSTSNIVLLLASLITSNQAQIDPKESIKSMPRLWALLGHSSTSVRTSVLRAMTTLIQSQKSTCLSWMAEESICTALRLVFQRSILENMDEVRPHIEEVWKLLIRIDYENKQQSHTDRFNLLRHTSQYLNYWLCLVMQPSNVAIDRGLPSWLNISADGSHSESKPDGEVYIGSSTFNAETINQQTLQVTKCRLLGTRLLGNLYANLVNDLSNSEESRHFKDTLNYLAEMFAHYLATKSANQRMFSGWTIESWADHQIKLLDDTSKMEEILPQSLRAQLNSAIQENSLYYDELASTLTRLQQEAREFVACITNAGITLNISHTSDKKTFYNLQQLQLLCDINLDAEVAMTKSKQMASSNSKSRNSGVAGEKLLSVLQAKQSTLCGLLKATNMEHRTLSTSVLSSLASALISWRIIPQEVKTVIDPLLESVETESQLALQDKSARYLVELIDILCQEISNKSTIENILTRLMTAISNQALLMINEATESQSINSKSDELAKRNGNDNFKIIQLDNLQRIAEMNRSARRHSSVVSLPSLKRSHSVASNSSEMDSLSSLPSDGLYTANDLYEVKLRGASLVLNRLVTHFGKSLPEKLPHFWLAITDHIQDEVDSRQGAEKSSNDRNLIMRLKLLEVVGESLDIDLQKNILKLYPGLISLLYSSKPVIRNSSCHCIRVISKLMLSETIDLIQKSIIPMLEQSTNTFARCGAIEAIALIIEHLHIELVPHINMFIIPILRRTSDQNDQVRLMATHCFGKLLSLMPLNLRNDDSSNQADNEGTKSPCDDFRFIEQLLDPKKLDNFKIPFDVNTELRSYQQDGLNWLAFLNRFNLHGILCDEMGLGKTLMTICMVASDHFLATKNAVEGKFSEQNHPTASISPSLIVCPPTLTEHWLYEIKKFLPSLVQNILNPIAYFGNISERASLRSHIISNLDNSDCRNEKTPNPPSKNRPVYLIVTSYDMIRIEIDFFKGINWNYCVLDEGHIIKNGKTKLSRSIRLLNAKHRLILSGTPIQNDVTELWSLFDFLMPGFLGSERQFNCRYAKPIILSREPKCSSRDQEAGALAMEALHRQVLPFILRRLKEDVLDDLPPKIIQDYYCELSPLQHKLYEDFANSQLCKDVAHKSIELLNEDNDRVDSEIKSKSKSTVFQALQYLKNVCNHPKLVLKEKHPQYLEIKKELQNNKTDLDGIGHSSKLKALKQLIEDCGIGVTSQTGDEMHCVNQQQQALTNIESVVNQHRALIFCQVRSMVDIIEKDLLQKHLPGVTYLKLDGSVPASQRYSIVSRFNNDPSIDILLLTTQIGGLGLNLTGADTVIFVEHDWNPTRDLQAIDRAHRIGQKKVVNVYRLITKGTLEEKIMGLQKFKTMVSNTVINQDNAGLGTMKVDQLLDLFESSEHSSINAPWQEVTGSGAGNSGERSSGRKSSGSADSTKTSSSFMDLLPELWDQQQYETEYDLSNFIASLKS